MNLRSTLVGSKSILRNNKIRVRNNANKIFRFHLIKRWLEILTRQTTMIKRWMSFSTPDQYWMRLVILIITDLRSHQAVTFMDLKHRAVKTPKVAPKNETIGEIGDRSNFTTS